MLCVASWYQLVNSEEYINYKLSKMKTVEITKKLTKGDTDGKDILN